MERHRYMKKSTLVQWGITLAVCALVFPVIGSSKTPVERPVKISGQVSTVIQLDGSFAFDASSGCSVGISSHTGRFTAAGWGNAFTGVWFLTATSANGDQISGCHVPGSSPDEFRYTSGTGRFEGVSGGFTYVTSVPSLVPNPDGSATMIISYTYAGTGTISY
jgi:hypothetical protein